MKHISSRDVRLPYNQMRALREQGKLALGVRDDVAAHLSTKGYVPQGGTVASYYLYMVFGYALIVAGIYFAFASAWWWAPIGFLAAILVWKGNRRGNSENVIDVAFNNAKFYQELCDTGALIYQVDDDTAILIETAHGE